MQIRAANDSDIPAIIDLLKISLGETLLPKSENYWRWKHIENPFGPSPVLLAVEDNNLIGVRALQK
jgi:N-acetylglutamate synthase-like GNAT family acetyltransferase